MIYIVIIVALLAVGAYAGYYFTKPKQVVTPAPVEVSSPEGAQETSKK